MLLPRGGAGRERGDDRRRDLRPSGVVWGRTGIFVRTTRDGGTHWWQTEMPQYVRNVGVRGDHLIAWMLTTRALRTLAYVSADGGLTWHLRFIPPLHARLFLSRRQVTPGQTIGVKATGCARLVDQPDEMTWHNHRQLTHAHGGHYVPVFGLRRQGTRITTSYRVPARSPRGKGLLDVYCGPASSGNAVGYLSVR
jgi:hypothetical protein